MKKLLLIILLLFGIQVWTYARVDALQDERLDLTRQVVSARAAAVGRSVGSFRDEIPGFDSLIGPKGLEILVFNPNCPACERAAPAWQSLAESRNHDGFGFAFLALEDEGADEFLRRHGIQTPRIEDNGALYKRLHVLVTPSTVVLRRDGAVEAMGALAATVAAKRTSWKAVAAEWPQDVRSAWISATAASFLGEFSRATELPLGEPTRNVHVFENDENIVGFAAIIRHEHIHQHTSGLEAWVVLDASARVRGVLPLREHRDRYHAIGRTELEAWSGEDIFSTMGDDSMLKGVFLEGMRSLRVDLGFPAKAPD